MSVGLGLSKRCPWPHVSDVGVSSVACFLDMPTRLTLSKVSRYFRELLESEAIQRQFLAQQSFKPLLMAQESTFQQYARFRAMHIAYPSMVRYHTEPVLGYPSCVRITPDGSTMAVLCRYPYYNIGCYDLPSMNERWRVKFIGINLGLFESRLRMSPDGTTLVFYDGQRMSDTQPQKPGLIVIDMQTGKQLLKFAQEEGNFHFFKMNPDGKSIATVSWREENKIKRWDLATGLCLQTFQKGDKNILQISPDGKVAISESGDGINNLEVWDVETGILLQTLLIDRRVIGPCWNQIEISQDNTIAIVWNSSQHALQFFDLTNGACIFTLKGDENDPILFNFFRISPNGKFVVGGHKNSLVFFNLETKRYQKTRLCNSEVNDDSVHITPDERGVVFGMNRSIEFWNFCELPEERLTRMYEYLERREKGHGEDLLEKSSMLPQFVKDEIREISFCYSLSDTHGYALYNATQVALPAIQKHLERATDLPKLSRQMASEAMRRILSLPDPVKEVVCKNFFSVRNERFDFLLKKDPYIEFTAALNCQFFIPDCLEAIQRTMKEYKNQFPLLDKCLNDFRKGTLDPRSKQ